MKYLILIGLLVLTLSHGIASEAPVNTPYEKSGITASTTLIDILVNAQLKREGVQQANLCSDEVFIRRVYIDVIGTLPTSEEVVSFLKDSRADKRAILIDQLLNRKEYAEYWSMKWCDLLRVKAEFPINLWPNAVQTYHRWIRDSLRNNKHYDVFVREMLTSSGSNFRVPPVNFYRAIQSHDSTAIAAAVALAFMGTRYEKMPAAQQSEMASFFTRVGYKGTAEWKEEIVYHDLSSASVIQTRYPDGTKVKILSEQDPRKVFADWLITPNNPWFSKNIVNRIWYWLMGRGIIHDPDDIRKDNPPVNPALLSYLEKEFVKSNYDLKHIYRIILNSRTYQASSIPKTQSTKSEKLFGNYGVRRLEAEVLVDALNTIGGTGEGYSSPVPEPFTNTPPYQRTISLSDGSITSQFLEMFGRPPRDSGLESERNNDSSDSQRLYLLNSNEIQRKIEQSPPLRKLFNTYKNNNQELIRMIYLTLLSRYPTDSELKTVLAYYKTKGLGQKQATDDLVWVLINSKEFLYRH